MALTAGVTNDLLTGSTESKDKVALLVDNALEAASISNATNEFGHNLGVSVFTDAAYAASTTISDNDATDLLGGIQDATNVLTTNLHGIMGMPYQFPSTVDRRLNSSKFGRKYSEKIVGRMPLLFLTPGSANFMKGFGDEDKSAILSSLSLEDDADASGILLGKNGRYFSFDFAYDSYYKFLNPMCQTVAKLLGIEEKEVTIGSYTAKLKNYDWSKATNDDFSSYFSSAKSIPFYLDSEKNITETFGNSTRESSLTSQTNGFRSQAQDLKFALGAVTQADLGSVLDLSGIGSEGGILDRISSGFTTVVQGGKLVFPKMWDDSDFSRSFSLSMKLRSPDHDTLSIYLNILVPYLHLVAMTAPHSDNEYEASNGMRSPFLVRGFYKGFFNVDMGIINSLQATKGKECGWNDDGLPTEMDISIDLEDLYTNMFLTDVGGVFGLGDAKTFVNNTAEIDYLSNLAALNLAKPELIRKVELYNLLVGSTTVNLPNRIQRGFNQFITNKVADLYNIFGF